ncbi:MAG TPA: nucleoside monophosphate kinase [archaeon]|nr:nucleoside monophosphate kinase [archaeon]
MIITICGNLGSGKSTLARELAKKFGLKHFSAGDFMRAIAKERNLSLLELGARAETDKSIDKEVDSRTQELGKTGKDFVMDSRLAWHFIPNSIKIFLDISLEEAARRVCCDVSKNLRAEEKESTTIKKTMENIKKRQESEIKRYRQLYGVNYLNKKNFDIVIDTTSNSREQTLEKAVQEIKKILEKKKQKASA